MIRILQVVNIMNHAGLENMIMNYYRNMDRSKIQFDFLTHRPEDGAFDEEIKRLGGKIYKAPRLYPQNYLAYFRYMKVFFKEHPEYKVIHSHIDAMSYLPLLAAQRAGVPVRIAHSHSTNIDKDFKYILKQIFRKQLNSVATERWACGREAGKYLFGDKEFSIIRNAIDVERFAYNEGIRQNKKAELNLTGKYVVGHVGRFIPLKNHSFILDVFDGLCSEDGCLHLLLIGDGELKENIEADIETRGLKDKVTILSERNDMNELYQAMDIFLLPSLYEGLPMVMVEAQVSGLSCIASDKVTKEAKIAENTFFLELDKNLWKEKVMYLKSLTGRIKIYDQEYDIRVAAKKMADKYIGLWNKVEKNSVNSLE